MECDVLSCVDIAAVKVATHICNSSNLKMKIISKPRPRWGRKRRKCDYSWADKCHQIIEKEARKILRKPFLPERLQEKCLGLVFLIAARMLTWVLYHAEILGLSRKHCINLLNCDFFTSRGVIDSKKAAEVLIQDKSLNALQRYTLSCLYCLVTHIPALYNKLTERDQESLCRYAGIVEFWTYSNAGEVDRHKGAKSLAEYRLEKAIQTGLLDAVEYCIDETGDMREYAIMWAAFTALLQVSETDDDRFAFRDINYVPESWVPRDYYMDMFHVLFTKMREDQQIVFLEKDIESSNTRFPIDRHSRILEYFLNWPYQDYFIKTAALMWEFLPETSYAILLVRICDRIECSHEPLKFGQEKCYDYRQLLKEFWHRSPEHFKRFVLSNQEIRYKTGTVITRKAGTQLLKKLISLKKFVFEDVGIIGMIFATAKTEERKNIIFSQEWINFCIRCLKKREWKILDRFLLNCFSSKDEENIFKMQLISTNETQCIFIDFVKRRQWKSAESLLKRSSLGEEEINKFKLKMLQL